MPAPAVKRQALEWLRFMQTSWVLHADPRLSVSVNIDSDGVEATGQWTVSLLCSKCTHSSS